MIVPFAAGGPTDLFARVIAQKLSGADRQEFLVENVGGAGGNIGTARAAQSAPDGYTVLVTGGNHTNNPYLYSHVPYDPIKDFDAVTLGGITPVVLAVNPSVPAQTVKELVALVRANSGKYSYASPGTGTPPQLVGALFRHSLDLDLVHVPFGGGGPAVGSTVAGHTPISFGAMAPAVPLIKDRSCVHSRYRQYPVTDLARDSDYGGGRIPRGRGHHVDRGSGAGRHAEEHRRTAPPHDRRKPRIPDVKQSLAAIAYEPIGNSPEECTEFFKAEMAKWSKVIKDAGIKPQ